LKSSLQNVETPTCSPFHHERFEELCLHLVAANLRNSPSFTFVCSEWFLLVGDGRGIFSCDED